jgi:stage II sporulation protein D
MFKKFALTLSATALLLSPVVTEKAGAATSVAYSSPINVQIYSGSNFTIGTAGFYELQNLQTGEKAFLQPNAPLTIAKSGTGFIASLNDIKFVSSTGFRIQELVGGGKIHTFSSNTPIYRSASTASTVYGTAKTGEAVEHIGVHLTPTNEKWFNVKTASGITGWVSRSTTYEPSTAPAPAVSLLTVNGKKYRGSLNIDATGKVINNLDMENYLKGVVPEEMPAYWLPEALKAQAIVARSYALHAKTLQNNTTSQVYGGYTSEDSRSSAAIDATNGIVVKYNGNPVQTFFFSTSGGKTANVSDVWNSNQASFPYLVTVDSPDEESPYNTWTEHLSSRKILSNFGYGPNTVLYDIQLHKPGQHGEVRGATLVTSEGTKSFGVTSPLNELQIRKYFKTDSNYLKSNWFDITEQKTYKVQGVSAITSQFGVSGQLVQLAASTSAINSSTVNIQTASGVISKASDPATINANGKGYGHRIGMSQYGAQAMAKKGVSGVNIVKHYFPGTTVSK